jgi:hypothetical protein
MHKPDKMQASMHKPLIYLFDKILEKLKFYELTNFEDPPNKGEYCATQRPHMLC